jgi:hypothetical protein
MLGNQLRKLRVTGTKLLKDGLQHLGLLLDDLAELLKLGVVAQEVQVAEVLLRSTTANRGANRSSSSLGVGSSTSSAATAPTTASLCCEIE